MNQMSLCSELERINGRLAIQTTHYRVKGGPKCGFWGFYSVFYSFLTRKCPKNHFEIFDIFWSQTPCTPLRSSKMVFQGVTVEAGFKGLNGTLYSCLLNPNAVKSSLHGNHQLLMKLWPISQLSSFSNFYTILTKYMNKKLVIIVMASELILLGKKSNYVIRFFETWGRNPVFQFSLETFLASCGKMGLEWDPGRNW